MGDKWFRQIGTKPGMPAWWASGIESLSLGFRLPHGRTVPARVLLGGVLSGDSDFAGTSSASWQEDDEIEITRNATGGDFFRPRLLGDLVSLAGRS
jgi:hypothetical protein